MKKITINYDDGPERVQSVAEMLLAEFGAKYTVNDGDGFVEIVYERP